MKTQVTRSYRELMLQFGRGRALLVCLLIAGCAPDSGDQTTDASRTSDGAVIFAENCAVCHLGGRAPRLESIKALSQPERANRMFNHPRAGDLAARLTAETLLDLIDFLNSVPPGATRPEGPGAERFIAECGVCHVGDGRGPSFVELGRLSESEFLARMRNHPVAGALPQRLTATQLDALNSFFEADQGDRP